MSGFSRLTLAPSPHIKTEEDIRSIMTDVVIALMPALAIAVFTFGMRAFIVTAVSVLGCVFFEWGYRKVLKKPSSIGDLSAVVTGILLAYCLPVTIPLWVVIIGDFVAIVIVKQLFGGIGKNFMNPALLARAVLFSWPVMMATWAEPRTALPVFKTPVDVISTATPLSYLKGGNMPADSIMEMALGQTAGCIGEISAVALVAGGLYLLYRRVITLRIPLSFIGTVALLTFLFPKGGADNVQFMLCELLSGGLMLGAIFMATDYTTSPVTRKGQIIFGIGCGALTVFIRYFGSYPEGVSYAILIMNALVWPIDKYTRPRVFGTARHRIGGR